MSEQTPDPFPWETPDPDPTPTTGHVPPGEVNPPTCPGCGVVNPDRNGHGLACPTAAEEVLAAHEAIKADDPPTVTGFTDDGIPETGGVEPDPDPDDDLRDRLRGGFRGGKVPPAHDRIELSTAALDLRAVDQLLDDLAEPVNLTRQTASMRDTILDVVRTRATKRRGARPEVEKLSTTDVRREAVGAADDADVLGALAGVFKAGSDEAKQIAGEILDDLPGRAGKPPRSMRVADGRGFELAIAVSKRSELSVKHDEVDDVLAAKLVAEVAGTDVVALGQMPVKPYAAGVRDGIAALRGVLASSPAYRSTALDSLVKQLQNLDDDDLAKRLTKAYGKVEKGEPSVKLERKPLETGDDQ